jgi:NitT/TauT family transport system permease protein
MMRLITNWRQTARRVVPPVVSFVVVILLAEAVIRLSGVSDYLLPAPSSVLAAAASPAHRVALLQALGRTALAATTGFALSAVIGITVAVLLSASRWIERAFYPFAIFFQTVPLIAIAPLLVIWTRTSLQAVIASAFIVSIFPVIANALTGLLSVDPALRDLFRLYRGGPLATLWKLRLPSALPQILTGLRIAAGLAVIGAIVGEFFAGGGLGILLQTALKEQRTDLIFAAVLMAALLGLALFGLVNAAGHLLLRHWHTSVQ